MFSLKQRKLNVFFFIAFLLLVPFLGYAQQVTRINPAHISFRGVSLSSLWTGIIVGDSSYIAITHTAYDWTDTPTFRALQSPFASPMMLDAVAYAGDTSHAVIAGEKGSLAWTSDDGATWHDVSIPTSVTIRALTWNHSTTSPVLVGVGDGGLIIWSTTQGVTWHTSNPATAVQLNAVSFGTPTDAVAVGNDTTMIQSHDGGQTWSPMAFPYDFHTWQKGMYENAMGAINFSGVAMAGADSVYVLFDTAMLPLLVYKGTAVDTTDSWYNNNVVADEELPVWATPPGSTMNDTIYPHWTSIIYIGMDSVFKNGGKPKLKLLTAGTSMGDFDFYVAGNDTNTNEGIYNLEGDVDGNVSWVTMRLRASAFWRQDTNLVVVEVGDECSIYKHTVNPGNAYGITRHVLPYPGKQTRYEFLGVSTLPNGIGYDVVVGPMQKTTDHGRTWIDLPAPIAPQVDSTLNNLYILDSANVLAVGWSGIILRYDPTGFHFLPSGTQERLESIAFPSHDTGIIVGDYGTVMQSVDRGESWKALGSIPTTERLYCVAFTNKLIGIATGDSATILRTTDEGVSWTSLNNLLTGTATSIRRLQAFPNGVFLAQAGTQLLRSTDFGQNWTSILPPNMSDTCGMNFYSSQIGMIAGRSTSTELLPDSAHLAYTTDGGLTWTPFSCSLWNANYIVINWVSDHEALVYGDFGFIDDVVISSSGVQVTRMDNNPTAQAFPNPFPTRTTITISPTEGGAATVTVLNLLGQEVAKLYDGNLTAGPHSFIWDARGVTAGTYECLVRMNGRVETLPVVLMR